MPGKSASPKSASTLRRWLMFFVLICMLALLWSMPASLLPRLLTMSNASSVVQITQTRGTLWSGQADQVIVNASEQRIVLENVNWRFNWRSLLDTRLCLDIFSSPGNTGNNGIRFDGQSCFFSSGAIELNTMLFEIPAAMLISAQLRNSPLLRTLNSAVQIEGGISGEVEMLVWQQGQLQQLNARGVWADAAVAMQLPDARTFRMRQQILQLGALPWTAASNGVDQFLLHVSSAASEQDADLDLRVDSQSEVWLDGRYTTQLQLDVLPSTPVFLRDILTIVAQPQGSGSYRMVWRNIGV